MKFKVFISSLLWVIISSSMTLAQPARVLRAQRGAVNSLAISPNSEFIAAGCTGKEEGTVLLWNLRTSQLLQTWTGYIRYWQKLAFSPDSKLLAISSVQTANGITNGTIEIRNLHTGSALWKLHPSSDVAHLQFSPDGHLIGCSSGDGRIRLFNANSGHLERTVGSDDFAQINAFAFSPDGKTIVGGGGTGRGGLVAWWNLVSGQLIRKKVASETAVEFFSYINNGREIVIGSAGGYVNIWGAQTGRQVRKFRLQTELGNLNAISPSCLMFAGALDLPFTGPVTEIGIWKADTGRLLEIFTGHKGVTDHPVAFSGDSKILASGGDDWPEGQPTTVYLWDLESVIHYFR